MNGFPQFDLTGQVALVTGAARGLGRAISLALANAGADVALGLRDRNTGADLAREIEAMGHRALPLQMDMAHLDQISRAVNDTVAHFGQLDILVNNAGSFGPVRPVEKIAPRDWDEVMAVNLRGPFLLSRLALPEMYERKRGAILNISSVAAKTAYPLNSAYATSKAALAGLTRTLAAEGARQGVRVNAICPGPVPETKMSQELTRELAEYLHSDGSEVMKRMVESILQGRPQTADEVAFAALFLVSDQASAITGQTLNVDGGMIFY